MTHFSCRYRMADQVQQDRTRAFQEFLNEDYGNNVYKQQIAKMIDSKRNRLIVDLNQLAAYNPQMCRGILESPMDYIPCFDEALSDTVKQLTDSDLLYRVGFSGSFGHHQVPVGQLGSQHLGQMLQVEGIVVRCNFCLT